jgi:Zn-dependent peptidase ImmA (M78 family)/transcriptional regulator with XRE-family HTH domain
VTAVESEFNGAELRLARVFRGLALEDVGEQVDKTRQYLHRLETGQTAPTEALIAQLADALDVEPAFFNGPPAPAIADEQIHFRKLFTTRAAVRQITIARAELFGRLVGYLDGHLKLPPVRIPAVDDARSANDVERAAERCRSEWGLGFGPIEHVTRLAENVGAVVTSFRIVSKEVDALSVALKRPIIVRNEAKPSACRQRFDVGHELGHFVLHQGRVTGDRVTEIEAHRFAGALLVPRSMMMKLFPRPKWSRLDWTGLRDFKLTWKVSKAALLYRARQLDLINDDQYRSGFITLKRTGEAITEREDALVPGEAPELVERAFSVLAAKKHVQPVQIAAALHIRLPLLEDLVGFPLTGSAADARRRPALSIVK